MSPKLQWVLKFNEGTLEVKYAVYPEGVTPTRKEMREASYIAEYGYIKKSRYEHTVGKKAYLTMRAAHECLTSGYDLDGW